jgi:heme A synthase
MTRFAKFAWLTLGYNILVILWGAFVRATGSGAGCGSHWPTCNGQIIPRDPSIETLIEFSHRLTSGLAFLLVLAMLIWAFRAYPRGHIVRLGAALSMFFMLTEALVGAGLVLFERVATDVSYARAVWMAAHLLNTFILLLFITLTAWWASGGARFPLRGQGWTGAATLGALFLMTAHRHERRGHCAGRYAAAPECDSHEPRRGRDAARAARLPSHTGGRNRVLYARCADAPDAGSPVADRLSAGDWLQPALCGAVGALGLVNVWLKAPVWMQLVHLLITDILWIMLVLFCATILATRPQEKPVPVRVQSL